MDTVGVAPKTERYYVGLGLGTDAILRCKDCRKLQLLENLTKLGSCECGNRRVVEVTTLTPDERAYVETLDFPHKAEFLAEFAERG